MYLFLADNIEVERINRRDRVDWVTREIRIHIRDLFNCVKGESMGGELFEHLLTEVNWYISIFVCKTIKSCS